MSKFAHVMFHVLLGAVQIANVASGIIPAPWNLVAMAGVELVRVTVSAATHGKTVVPK